MNYVINGNLIGLLCNECEAPITNTSIRVYQAADGQADLARAVAPVKETFHEVKPDEIKARGKKLLGEAQLDEKGNFSIHLSEKSGYKGGAVDIDWYCGTVPVKVGPKPKKEVSLQFHLTTLVPLWKRGDSQEEVSQFYWSYAIPAKWFCRILSLFGLYVICGRVVNCANKIPISKLKVSAFDTDLIQDDVLGSAITDVHGRFQIWYNEAAFTKTIFDWLNLEWSAGPDVYFKIETLGGNVLLEEPRSKGRTSGRENIGHCFCIELCVDPKDTPTQQPVPIPAFLRVGGIDHASQINSAPFGNGLTMSNYAFFSSLRLNGILSQSFGGQPLEYCFEYTDEYDGSGNPVNWKRVLPGQISPTHIGYLEKATLVSSPFPHYVYNNKDYYVSNSPVPGALTTSIAADGWILVPQENDSPLAGGMFVPNGNQLLLNSQTLSAFPSTDLTGLVAGNSVTSTGKPLVQDKVFALRMLVREQGNNATRTEAGSCIRIAINNYLYNNIHLHPSWAGSLISGQYGVCMLDILQLQGGGCSKITDRVDIWYTNAHPNLGSMSCTLKGPGGVISLPIGPVSEDAAGSITHTFTPADPNCAYLVTLSATLLLTTGDSNLPPLYDQIAFCR